MPKKKANVSSITVEKGKKDIVAHPGGGVSMGPDGVKVYRLLTMKSAMEMQIKGLPMVKHDVFEQARKEFQLEGRNHDVYMAFCEMHGLEPKVTWDPDVAAEEEDEAARADRAEKTRIAEFIKQPSTPGPPQFEVRTIVAVKESDVDGLLCCAFEGGSGYWAQIVSYAYAPGVSKEDFDPVGRYCYVPLREGCAVIIKDETDQKLYRLDRASLQRGLQVMAEKYPKHFSDFVNENTDAITGDVFLQCCLLGEIVYS